MSKLVCLLVLITYFLLSRSISFGQEVTKACQDAFIKQPKQIGIAIRAFNQARHENDREDKELGSLLAGSIKLVLLGCAPIMADVIKPRISDTNDMSSGIPESFGQEKRIPTYLVEGSYEIRSGGLFKITATLQRIGQEDNLSKNTIRPLSPIEVHEEHILKAVDLLAARIINETASNGPIGVRGALILATCTEHTVQQDDENRKQVSNEVIEAFDRAINKIVTLRRAITGEKMACAKVQPDLAKVAKINEADAILYWVAKFSASEGATYFTVSPKLLVPSWPSTNQSVDIGTLRGSNRSLLSLALFREQLESLLLTFFTGAIGIDGKLRLASLQDYQSSVEQSHSFEQLLRNGERLILARELDLATCLIKIGLAKYEPPPRSRRGNKEAPDGPVNLERNDVARGRLLFLLAEISLIRGEQVWGQRLLTEAAKLAPAEATIHKKLGEVHELNGDIIGARDSYTTYLRLQPNDGGIRIKLGRIYLKYEDFKEARAQFSEALLLDQQNPEASYGLVNSWFAEASAALQKHCDKDTAIQALQHLIEMDPKDHWASLNLSELYLLTRQFERAERLLEEHSVWYFKASQETDETFVFLYKHMLFLSKLYLGKALSSSLEDLETSSKNLRISQDEWDFSLLNDFLRKGIWKDESIRTRFFELNTRVFGDYNISESHGCRQPDSVTMFKESQPL